MSVDVCADVALVDGFLDYSSDDLVEASSLLQSPSLGLGVAVHAQQQRHVGESFSEDLDVSPDDVQQPVNGTASGRLGLADTRQEGFESTFERQPEQMLLALDVVLDRGLGQTRGVRQVLEARPVLPALGEHLNRGLQQRVEVVSGARLSTREPSVARGSLDHSQIMPRPSRERPTPQRKCASGQHVGVRGQLCGRRSPESRRVPPPQTRESR